MKLQHVSVMFILIFIPIILVTSYFISLQVKTIKLESEYDEKLLNATYDAMTAFELNTANEKLSSVADSLRSIIDASNNIFFNTLCTNLGVSNASKSFVQPYIPAILYTLYDGYYLYTPTNLPEICVDKYGRTIRTSDLGVKYNGIKNNIGIYEFKNDAIKYNEENNTEPEDLNYGFGDYKVKYSDLDIKEEYGQILYKNNDGTYSVKLHSFGGAKESDEYKKSTYYKRDYILKSYIPYSANYISGNKNVTINYTLDNFLTVEGNIDKTYYTKSGYLIDKDLIKEVNVDGVSISWTDISKDVIDKYVNNPVEHEVKVTFLEGKDSDGNDRTISISNRDGVVLVNKVGGGAERKYWDDAQSAVQYYVDSYIFSNWFYENLSDIKASDINNQSYSVSDIENVLDTLGDLDTNLYKKLLYNFNDDSDVLPFSKTNNNPESEESFFYNHKRNVIKNSITYNLLLTMIVYTDEAKLIEYNMPVLKESEWDRILNNVSITTFMEGLSCGLKTYNNYAIVTSTNNEIAVDENEIFYVPRELQVIDKSTSEPKTILSSLSDDNSANDRNTFEIAHRIDCSDLILGKSNNFFESGEGWTSWLGCLSFKSKEIKYDKILDKNGQYIYDHKVWTDYDCIVDSNYTVEKSDGAKIDGNNDILNYLQENCSFEYSVDKKEEPSDSKKVFEKNIYYKLKAYRIAVAKERNNLYKTTAFRENDGWQVLYFDTNPGNSINVGDLSKKESKQIKEVEVTIEKISGVGKTDSFNLYFNSESNKYGDFQTIQVDGQEEQTRTLKYTADLDVGVLDKIILKTNNSTTSFVIKAVKVYYK